MTMRRTRLSWPCLLQLLVALSVRSIAGGAEEGGDRRFVSRLVVQEQETRHDRYAAHNHDQHHPPLPRFLEAQGFDFELIQLARSGIDIEINRYIDGGGMKRCRDNLLAADADDSGQLNQAEYATFVTLESDGALNETFAGLGASFISLFYVVACDQCYDSTLNDTCCVGNGVAMIDLPASGDDTFDRMIIFLCSSAEKAIAEAINPTPAPVTTSSPTAGEPAPQPIAVPTKKPSGAPTTTTTKEPSSAAPTPTPAASTPKPTERSPTKPPPTQIPSDRPSELPTRSTTIQPTRTPSQGPATTGSTGNPTSAPSNPRTVAPTTMPNTAPASVAPNLSTTPVAESPTAPPTATIPPADLLCIQFFFSIQNRAGLTASDIELGINNTLRDGLEAAARNVTITILNETFPRTATSSSSASSGSWQRRTAMSSNIFGRFPGEQSAVAKPVLEHPTVSWVRQTQHDSGDDNGALLERRVCQALSHEFGFATSVDMLDALVSTLYNNAKVVRSPSRRQLLQPVDVTKKQLPSSQRRHKSSSSSMSRQHRRQRQRRLVYYTDMVPPNVTNVVDDPFCPQNTNSTTTVKCAIVAMQVCVVLETGDNATAIETALSDGFGTAITTGTFFDAIPPENLP